MKHILNDLSSEEKNRILEQYSGQKIVDVKNFNRLLESQLGNVKPLLNEQASTAQEIVDNWAQRVLNKLKKVLGKTPQFTTCDTDYNNKCIPKTDISYFFESVDYVLLAGNPTDTTKLTSLDVTFKTHYLDYEQDYKITPAKLNITFVLNNGYPTGISSAFAHRKEDADSVNEKAIADKMIPIIKGVRCISMSRFACFDKNKGFEYNDKNTVTSYLPAGTEFYEKKNTDRTWDVYIKDKTNEWVSGKGMKVSERTSASPFKFKWTCTKGVLVKQ